MLRYPFLAILLLTLLITGFRAADVWFIPSLSEGKAKCLAISSITNISYSVKNLTSGLNTSCASHSCYAIVQPIPGGRIYITGRWP